MKFLVPVDFEGRSEYSTLLALNLAQRTGAEVFFLHLMHLPKAWGETEQDLRLKKWPAVYQAHEQAIKKLGHAMEQAKEKGVTASYHIHPILKHVAIINYARQIQADLIIMGAHNKTDIASLFLGSYAHYVVRSASMPVLIAREHVESINTACFVSDFSEEALDTVQFFSQFLKSLSIQLHLLYINTPANFSSNRAIEREFHKFNRQFGLNAKGHLYNDYDFQKALEHFCEDYPVDLLIMNTHGRKGLDIFTSSSLTEKVMGRVDLPVLALPLLTHAN